MTTNRLLMNLNRNANNVDRLFMQLSSGKVIQRPSDNPIVASRALRFRTNVTEVQQHQRNVAQAQSWMEVSEQNLHNMTQILTTQRHELMVQGASGTYTFQNRQTITRVIELMFQQMHTELNGTFAGRYVFSGFRTDQPPIITQNNLTTAGPPTNDIEFEISKTVNRQDIQDSEVVFWRDPASTPPGQLNVVATYQWLNRPDRVPANWETDPNINLTVVGSSTANEGINILRLPYQEVLDDAGNVIRQFSQLPEFAPPSPLAGFVINDVAVGDAPNPYLPPPPGTITFIRDTGEMIINGADLHHFNAPGVELNYAIDGVFQGELNPVIFFDTNRIHNGQTMMFSQSNQELQFEMGVNTHLTINTQARHAVPWQKFADMASLVRWVNDIHIHPDFDSNSEEAARERAFFTEQLYSKFTNTMARFDQHMQITTTEFTALGSRMDRMEMISIRLDENEDTFRALRDENENIDYIEILMRLNSAEAVFQAAMQIGARVNQLSLVNFI